MNRFRATIVVELKLSTANGAYADAIAQTGATSLADWVFYGFYSIVPQLEGVFEELSDFEKLNQLVKKSKLCRNMMW